MLDDPEAKHDLAVHIPDGHLLTGHVIDLAALLSKKRGAAWSGAASGAAGRSVAFLRRRGLYLVGRCLSAPSEPLWRYPWLESERR